MSKRNKARSLEGPKSSASLFAALGDPTRLRVVTRLCENGPMSIASLTAGSKVTRQAITKHLRVMEEAGLLQSTRQGRESVWELDQERIREVRRFLKMISRQWDDVIDRLENLGDS